MIVYVDGENLVHHLVHLLRAKGRIKKRYQLTAFDLTGLCREALGGDDVAIRYYTTKLKKVPGDTYDKRTEEWSKQVLEWNAAWTSLLADQGVSVIKAGNLRLKEGLPCTKCGHQELIFQEKGVDVKLAIDLALESGDGVRQAVFSSDSDIIPGIQAAKQRGSRVKNIALGSAINMGLAYSCGEWQRLSDDQIVAAYDRAQGKEKQNGK